jgi:hypothetical protein
VARSAGVVRSGDSTTRIGFLYVLVKGQSIVGEITMQQALQIHTRVDEATVNAIPALQPLLGHRVQMIALDLEQPDSVATEQKITFEQFLAHRLKRPEGVSPVSLEDMEGAIIQGALDGNI